MGLARDFRQLGVAIRQIAVWKGSKLRLIPADDAHLETGFHPFEDANGYRWTNGQAHLPPHLFEGFDGPISIELQLAGSMQYPVSSV